MDSKVCNVCNIEKPLTDFGKQRDRLRPYCRKCSTVLGRQWREKYPEKYKEIKERNKVKRKSMTDEERKLDNLKKRAYKRGVSMEVILEEERISELAESQNKKYCYGCYQILDKECFGKLSMAKDGLNTTCKLCRKKVHSEYYTENKDLMYERRKPYIENNRRMIMDRQNRYIKNRKKYDPLFKLSMNLRARVKSS